MPSARCIALVAAVLAAVPGSAHAGTLPSVPAGGGRPTVVARVAGASFGAPCWRADGALAALAERPNLGWRFGTFRVGSKPRWRAPAEEVISAYFAPGCELVAEVHYGFADDREGHGGVLVRDAAGQELTRVETVEPGEPETVVWSPDGSRFAVVMWERSTLETLRVIDARSGRVLARRRAEGTELATQAFSPDGGALVFTESDRLLVHDVLTGKARVLAGRGDGRTFRSPAWSPKGDRIAAVNTGGGIELLDPALGHGPALATASLFTEEIAWAPDGASLALLYTRRNRQGLALVAAAPGARPRRVLTPARFMQVPVWSPDGSAVAATR